MKHFIILSSSYYEGRRICMHYDEKYFTRIEDMQSDLEQIKNECGEHTSISTHFMTTHEHSFESVVEQDAFFHDVKMVDTLSEFIELIKKDRILSGLDIAKYILSKCNCTHLKLQKLVYFCYADYLCRTKNKLFADEIFAYRYGPVTKSVYERYKGSQSCLQDDVNIETKSQELPSRSRILFAEDGIIKLNSIDGTLEKYSKYTASQLVDLTHQKNSPWDKTEKTSYSIITDEIIIKYHSIEMPTK